jgi:protein TonB
MRDPFVRPFSGSNPQNDSWLNRIRENLAQLLMPSHFKPTAANGAPIHLLKFDKTMRPARAQGVSLLAHAAIFLLVLYLLARTGPDIFRTPGPTAVVPPLSPSSNFLRSLLGPKPSDAGSRGGGDVPIPATHGNPPPYSRIVLVKPSLPQNRESQVPIPPTLFDTDAPPILAPTPKIGLLWMPDDTNSPGPGKGHTLGAPGGDGAGDRGPGPYGEGELNTRYGPNFSPPTCAYCPIPTYTDDARHVKVQGTVTVQVLVGTDGRAQDIRMVKGVGYGLDERAVETIRGWKFVPARDSAKHTVATWITIEAVFRLF